MTKPNPDDYFGDSKGEAKPKGKRSLNPDDYFGPIEPPKPKAEKPPGLIKRGLAAVGSVLTNPSYAAAADGQCLADAMPALLPGRHPLSTAGAAWSIPCQPPSRALTRRMLTAETPLSTR